MSFSAIVPLADVDAANAALEAAGFGPDNFSVPLWRDDDQIPDSYGMNAAGVNDAFRVATQTVPNVSIREAAPGAVEFDEHVAELGLKRLPTPIVNPTDPCP